MPLDQVESFCYGSRLGSVTSRDRYVLVGGRHDDGAMANRSLRGRRRRSAEVACYAAVSGVLAFLMRSPPRRGIESRSPQATARSSAGTPVYFLSHRLRRR